MTTRKTSEPTFSFESVMEEIFGASFGKKSVTKKTVNKQGAPETIPGTTLKGYSTLEYVSEMDLVIDLPGIPPSRMTLEVSLDKVIVKGERYGKSFVNTYTISREYVTHSAKAWLSNGQLTVRLLKSPDLGTKVIPITVI